MKLLDNKFRCQVAEGPLWHAEKKELLFLDILGKCIFRYQYITGEIQKINVGQQIGCMAICENDELLLAMEDGIYRMDKMGNVSLAHQPMLLKGKRFNDGKVGPDGCFYAGTADDTGKGAFYRLKDGVLEELFEGCTCSNGLDWSLDGKKMFYCDTPKQEIEVFDFDVEKHILKNRRSFVKIPKEWGKPDGFTMDSKENIWICLWDGNAVIEIKKDGSTGEKMKVPARKVSSCCFGGGNLDCLFITTASKEDAKEYPLSGYVFEKKMCVKGKKNYKYRGIEL